MSLQQALWAHRFGFGPRAGQLPRNHPADALSRPDQILARYPAPSGVESLRQATFAQRAINEASKLDPEALRAARKAGLEGARLQTRTNKRLELARAVASPEGFYERLVRFWADHFTVAGRTVLQQTLVTPFGDEAIRPHVGGRFADMLRAATMHPAMLLYLDQGRSVGPNSRYGRPRKRGVNENLGRELLELHTLGVEGGYSQKDVRQAALLLTGLATDVESATGVTYYPLRAEPGAETVLGKSYGGDKGAVEDVWALLEDLANHPATARHLSGKLATHFVSDSPPTALVEDLTAVWRDSGGDLARVSRTLIDHPLAMGPALAKARQPFDFVASALRALEYDPDKIVGWNFATLRRTALDPMKAMGQEHQRPNGPDGWEEDFDRWITPQALAARIDWSMQLPRRLLGKHLPDARAFVGHALADLAPEALIQEVARAETQAEGIGLILASPTFNRR